MDGSRLKILYISRAYTTHDRRFLESFVKTGWRPAHLALETQALDRRPLPHGVERLSWREAVGEISAPVDWVGREGELRVILAEQAPDAVIAGPIQSGAFVSALADATPLVAVSWGSDMLVDADSDSLMRFITDFTLERSQAVFGDCHAVREAVKRHSTLPDERIVTFPWGVDLQRFFPAPAAIPVRRDLGWEECDVFISTRSWEPVYAIDVLVAAFARLRAASPRARLLLLGDGSMERAIRAQIQDLDLARVVHAPGRVPYEAQPDYFRSADVYVSSALSDGTSVSLVEAMACGLPAVVSRSHGNLEWVEEGRNGALADPGDAGSLAEALERVLSDRVALRRMSEANAALARERADWEANFPALAGCVESLVTT